MLPDFGTGIGCRGRQIQDFFFSMWFRGRLTNFSIKNNQIHLSTHSQACMRYGLKMKLALESNTCDVALGNQQKIKHKPYMKCMYKENGHNFYRHGH